MGVSGSIGRPVRSQAERPALGCGGCWVAGSGCIGPVGWIHEGGHSSTVRAVMGTGHSRMVETPPCPLLPSPRVVFWRQSCQLEGRVSGGLELAARPLGGGGCSVCGAAPPVGSGSPVEQRRDSDGEGSWCPWQLRASRVSVHVCRTASHVGILQARWGPEVSSGLCRASHPFL